MPLLQVRNLNVRFSTADGDVHVVKDANFEIAQGECLGVVGESGSGKSQLFLSSLGLLAGNGRVNGSVLFRGQELLHLPSPQINKIRGTKIGMIFQDPLTSLTPHMKIGSQLIETLQRHKSLSRQDAERRAKTALDQVRIPEAQQRMQQFPHELSGGMRQRVMIAMAIICEPDLLIADEPTTALDVTVQAQILDILSDLKKDLNTAIILISHDMGVIAGLADKVQVMRLGEIAESGPVEDIFYTPKHYYTQMLLKAMPRLDKALPLLPSINSLSEPILKIENLKVHFPFCAGGIWGRKKDLRAVDGVSFELRQGETLGIVGESGCGKSTLARAIIRLVPATMGSVVWCGKNILNLKSEDMRRLRDQLQIVFQDPLASLDPRMTIGQSIAEPLRALKPYISRDVVNTEVRTIMERVGLDSSWVNRYPHEFSGGQNQRVGIARAMIMKPKLLILDEAVSALDASIQAQIVDLILQLQRDFKVSTIFISHDLSVVRQVCHRVMVLYMGRIVELADRERIYTHAQHPYTRALLSSIPVPDPSQQRAKPRLPLCMDIPSPLDRRAQLGFLKSRIVDDPDAEQYRPILVEVTPGHFVEEYDGMALSGAMDA